MPDADQESSEREVGGRDEALAPLQLLLSDRPVEQADEDAGFSADEADQEGRQQRRPWLLLIELLIIVLLILVASDKSAEKADEDSGSGPDGADEEGRRSDQPISPEPGAALGSSERHQAAISDEIAASGQATAVAALSQPLPSTSSQSSERELDGESGMLGVQTSYPPGIEKADEDGGSDPGKADEEGRPSDQPISPEPGAALGSSERNQAAISDEVAASGQAAAVAALSQPPPSTSSQSSERELNGERSTLGAQAGYSPGTEKADEDSGSGPDGADEEGRPSDQPIGPEPGAVLGAVERDQAAISDEVAASGQAAAVAAPSQPPPSASAHSSGREFDGESSTLGAQTSYSPGTRRRLMIFASAVALALGGAFLFVHHQKAVSEAQLADTTKREASDLPRVDVVTVGPAPSTQTLVLPGETAAWYTATIFARVNGYVGQWFHDIGDHVKKGQVLATIETPELDAEFDSAKAKLRVSKAQVFLKQAQLEFARTTYERWQGSPRGAVSDQEREDKKARYGEALAELEAARSQVSLNQALVDRDAALVDFKRVTAPFDGTIIERRIDLGNLVTAGSTTNTTVLYRMTLDDPMRVFVDAPQSTAAQLMIVGTPGVITCDYRPNERFKGSVTRTAEAINPEVRTLRVEVDIPNPNHKLVPGTYVNVTFQLKSSGLIEIPAAALLFRTKGPQVAVIKGIVDEHGVVDIRDVTIARDNGDVVEISAGLEKGDKVALNLSGQIVNREKVQLHDVNQERLKGVEASAH